MNVLFKVEGVKNLADLKSLPDKGVKLFLFGETHGFLDDIGIQKEILEIINPEYYLYEMLEDKNLLNKRDFSEFLSNSDEKDFSVISTYGELKPTISMLNEMAIKVVGCDIQNMGRENKDFLKIKELTPEQEKKEEDLLRKRERVQAERINDYSKKNKKVFASLGAYHLRKGSLLLDKLNEKKFVLFYPVYKGKPAFAPEEDMKQEDISYIAELKESN